MAVVFLSNVTKNSSKTWGTGLLMLIVSLIQLCENSRAPSWKTRKARFVISRWDMIHFFMFYFNNKVLFYWYLFTLFFIFFQVSKKLLQLKNIASSSSRSDSNNSNEKLNQLFEWDKIERQRSFLLSYKYLHC